MTAEAARQLEERLIHVWPAVTTLLRDGWAIRFANGYSGRANSASAITANAVMSETLLDRIEEFYADARLRPMVRFTPVAHPAVASLLERRGYGVRDQSHTMTVDLASREIDSRVVLATDPAAAWLDGVCRSQPEAKRSPENLNAIVSRIKVPAAFATLVSSGEPVAFGLCAIDRGWAEIGCVTVDGGQRGKGLGRAIVTSLMGWAEKAGAGQAFLQVDCSNSVAVGLYRRLGFATLYDYQTLFLPD